MKEVVSTHWIGAMDKSKVSKVGKGLRRFGSALEKGSKYLPVVMIIAVPFVADEAGGKIPEFVDAVIEDQDYRAGELRDEITNAVPDDSLQALLYIRLSEAMEQYKENRNVENDDDHEE